MKKKEIICGIFGTPIVSRLNNGYSSLMLHLCYTSKKPIAKKEKIGYDVSVTKHKVLDYKKIFFQEERKMRNFKRFLTLALAMVMLVSVFAMGTSAAKFTDVDEENEYLTKAVNLLSYVGVTKGTTDTTFGTDELVTREQMAAFIYRLMKKGNSVEGGANTSAFTDLEDATFFFMVSWANNQGIIKGTSATTFDPKGSITLQDAYTMVVRALGYEKEETLPYPFGYIDVAEDKDVALNEGLGSEVSYTDALTRGDVAVILYNAFFAETGVAETKQVEREIGEGNNSTWVLETVTEYPTFCEKYFDVLEVEYQAIATPNYVFGADETTAELGYDAIEFEYVGEERTDAPAQFYAAYEDLGLEGDADDYIMSYFTMYVILDDDDKIEEILYAEPLMTKKTVNEIKFGTLSSNTANSYYDSDYSVKRLNGKVEFDGEVAYFYGAPYSYAKPAYESGMTDAEKYNARNEENLQFITFGLLGDAEDAEYKYELNEDIAFVDNDDEYFRVDSVTLIDALIEAYVGGLYEADVYDVDGDGLYDYINYKPYTAWFVNTDDDYTFAKDNYLNDGKTVYTNEAVLEGVEFEDEDFVIGYFDADANYIKAAAVVAPVEGNITGIKSATGIVTVNGETKINVKDGWKTIANFDKADLKAADYVVEDVEWDVFDALLTASAYDADDAKFYVYEDVLLFQDGIDSKVRFDSNLIVITPDEDGEVIETGAFNKDTGRTTYVNVWVDGKVMYVPVDKDAEVYPNLVEDLEAYENGDPSVYVNKVATYSVDGDGLYTIKLLGNAYDDEAMAAEDYVGLDWFADVDFEDEEDDEIQGYNEYADGYLVKNSGKRFRLRDAADRTGNAVVDFDFLLNSDTIILIRNEYDNGDEVDFVEIDVADLTETITNQLTNIQVVVENNVDYTNRENLVLLFAEVIGDEIEYEGKIAKKAERIVKMTDVQMDEDGDYYAVYDLFNPYTGAVENDVPGTYKTSEGKNFSAKWSYGDIVVLESGKVADKASSNKEGDLLEDTLYWVMDYNKEEGAIEVIEVPADGDEEGAGVVTYRVDVSDAAVTIIGHQANGFNQDMIRWGSLKVADVNKLDGSDKSYLAVNKAYAEDADDTLKTVYGKYVKVYLDLEWEDDSDYTAVNDDDFNAEANFIVVVAHTGEEAVLCNTKK